jgi:hypothetical protein
VGVAVGVASPVAVILFGNELSNFIRSNLGTNAYPCKLPQADTDYPLLSYAIVGGDNELLLSGPCGLGSRRVQLDAWSPLASEVETLAERLRLLFRAFKGPMGRLTVTNCNRHGVGTFSAPPVDWNDSGTIYRFMSEFTIWFRE